MKKLILPPKKCPQCGKMFDRSSCRQVSDFKEKIFCSNKCFHKSHRGEKSSHYKPLKERILSAIKVLKNGCWKWCGWWRSKGERGFYGGIKHKGESILAHRASYEVFVGTIPNGLNVLHKCDNTMCVNPDHLFLGTQDDNMKDMAKKLRGSLGEKSARSPLKKGDILKIRSLSGKMLNREIAKHYRVSTTSITNIINRKSWRHI